VNDHLKDGLLAFQLGAVEDADRTAIEEHLIACPSCLKSFLDLKRQVEQAADPGQRPSEALRQRLRENVARRVPIFRERRLRLVVGATLAAAIVVGIVVTSRPKPTTPAQTQSPIFIDVGTDPQAQSAL
jgi:hypothetical protein